MFKLALEQYFLLKSRISVFSGTEVHERCGVSCVRSPLSPSDRREMTFWSTDPLESPSGDLFSNIVHKAHFIRVFERLMPRLDLSGGERILEVGGGHCWASALVKKNYPECYVVASDLSPDAVWFVEKYESILQTTIDEKWSFNCRQIPFADEQFDRIFTFAAFHHFGEDGDFHAPIQEMVRALKPTGKIILLYEPSTPKWVYRWAFERVNRKRAAFSHVIDEDVLVLSKLRRTCEQLDCRFEAQYFTGHEEREGIVEKNYYFLLSRIKLLSRLFPCTVNITIKHL